MRKKSYICSVNVKYVLSVAQASVCNGFVGYSTVNERKGTWISCNLQAIYTFFLYP